MKKERKQTVTKSDMNINNESIRAFPIATQVISDGIVITNNLKKLKIGMEWLEQQLKMAKVDSIANVFYAEVQQDGTLYIDNKKDIQ